MTIPCKACRISEYLKPEAHTEYTEEGCRFQNKCLARLIWFQAEYMHYTPPSGEDEDPCDIVNTAYHFDKNLNRLLKEYFV